MFFYTKTRVACRETRVESCMEDHAFNMHTYLTVTFTGAEICFTSPTT